MAKDKGKRLITSKMLFNKGILISVLYFLKCKFIFSIQTSACDPLPHNEKNKSFLSLFHPIKEQRDLSMSKL